MSALLKASRCYRFADLMLDTGRRQVWRKDQSLPLTRLTFDLLAALVEAAPDVAHHEHLVAAAWGPRRIVTLESLAQRIKSLRRSLGDSAKNPRYIVGVRGLGYRIVPPVHCCHDRRGVALDPVAAPAQTELARSSAAKTLAVLPFHNLSPHADDAFYASSLHEEVIAEIAQLVGLNVIARWSVSDYGSTDKPAARIAAELGADYLIRGTASFENHRIRMNVELLSPDLEAPLWSVDYDEDLSDAFGIKIDIANRVSRALVQRPHTIREPYVRKATARSAEAYALYLRALSLWSTRDHGRTIETILLRAIDIDREFAPALGLLAYLQASKFVDTINSPASDVSDRDAIASDARLHATAGLALDPKLGVAMTALAMIDLHTWHWSAARRGFDAIIEPGRASDISAWFYCWTGDPTAAVRRSERDFRLRPNSWIAHRDLGITLAYAGNLVGAREHLLRADALAPANGLTLSWLTYLDVLRGENAAACARLKDIRDLFAPYEPFVLVPELAYCSARAGDLDGARRLAAHVEATAECRTVGCGAWALAKLALGETDQALQWLERAAQRAARHETDPSQFNLMNLRMNFLHDPLLDEPPFRAVLDRIQGD